MAIGRPPTCTCGTCRKCKHAAYMRDWYRKNAERGREIAAGVRARNIEKIRERDRVRGYREQDKMKEKARNATRTLARQACVRCGATPADAHHHDYSKPLEVTWLCKPCHGREHRTF